MEFEDVGCYWREENWRTQRKTLGALLLELIVLLFCLYNVIYSYSSCNVAFTTINGKPSLKAICSNVSDLFRKYKLIRLHKQTGNYHPMSILNARLFLNPCATLQRVNVVC